jgi:hypothetical protein
MSDCNFKVGDRVSWLGLKGTVTEIAPEMGINAIRADFENGEMYEFSLDGTWVEGQRPSLKKLKKKKARYLTLVPAHQSGCEHHFLFQDQNGTYSGPKCLEGHWLKDCGTKRPKGSEKPKGAE